MERTPPGDDKKPGEEPKDKELPLPQVAEGQVPAEQGGYRGYGTSPTQSESDLFAEYQAAVGAPSAPPADDVIEGWKLRLGKSEPALLQVLAHKVGIELISTIGQNAEQLTRTLLAFEVTSRPKVQTADEANTALITQLLQEVQLSRAESAASAKASAEQIEGLQARVVKAEELAEAAGKRADRLAARKSSADDSEEEDGRNFVTHYDSKIPRADASVVINPHQNPPRPVLCKDKPHLFHNLAESVAGRELKKHSSEEAWLEYTVLKSSLSFFWDANQYLEDFTPLFGSPSPVAKQALECLKNSYAETYDLLSTQLNLIQWKVHQKSKNPTWKLTEDDKERFEYISAGQKTFEEEFGAEGDTPEWLYKRAVKYSKDLRKNRLTQLSKNDAKKPFKSTAPAPPIKAKKGNGGGGGAS